MVDMSNTARAETMTSIYADYIDHNESELHARATARNAAGDGDDWGREDHAPREAATAMGAIIACELDDGSVLAELSDRLYMVIDAYGPWALEVATREDIDS